MHPKKAVHVDEPLFYYIVEQSLAQQRVPPLAHKPGSSG